MKIVIDLIVSYNDQSGRIKKKSNRSKSTMATATLPENNNFFITTQT